MQVESARSRVSADKVRDLIGEWSAYIDARPIQDLKRDTWEHGRSDRSVAYISSGRSFRFDIDDRRRVTFAVVDHTGKERKTPPKESELTLSVEAATRTSPNHTNRGWKREGEVLTGEELRPIFERLEQRHASNVLEQGRILEAQTLAKKARAEGILEEVAAGRLHPIFGEADLRCDNFGIMRSCTAKFDLATISFTILAASHPDGMALEPKCTLKSTFGGECDIPKDVALRLLHEVVECALKVRKKLAKTTRAGIAEQVRSMVSGSPFRAPLLHGAPPPG